MRLLCHIFILLAPLVSIAAPEAVTLKVGYFPNLTHSPALVARQWEREKSDWFQAHLPPGSKIAWRAFNAGPSAMEALLVGSIDVAFVGPSPVLNAHIRTKGAEIRVLASVARGGSALVVRKDLGLKTAENFRGLRLVTPQLGNTQDIEARAWLRGAGLKVMLSGGDVQIIPASSADMAMLFSQGKIAGAWTVEPWVTRLTTEFGGEILLERPDSIVTVLATSRKVLEQRGPAVRAFVQSYYLLRDQLLADPVRYAQAVRLGLGAETHSAPPSESLMAASLGRVRLEAREESSARVIRLTDFFTRSLKDSQDSGLLVGSAPLAPLLESLVPDPLPSPLGK